MTRRGHSWRSLAASLLQIPVSTFRFLALRLTWSPSYRCASLYTSPFRQDCREVDDNNVYLLWRFKRSWLYFCQTYAKEWEGELVCRLNLWTKRGPIYVVARWQGMLAVRVIPRLQPVPPASRPACPSRYPSTCLCYLLYGSCWCGSCLCPTWCLASFRTWCPASFRTWRCVQCGV